MNSKTAYYSIMQYCPDFSRAEVANIGVALFCPETDFLEIKISKSNRRISKYFKNDFNLNLNDIEYSKVAIKNRLKVCKSSFSGVEDFQKFIDTRANKIQFTQPRSISVITPKEDLENLYSELVSVRKQNKTKSDSKLKQRISSLFLENDLSGKIDRDKKIEMPIYGRERMFPFAYQNGVLNLIQVEEFTSNNAVDIALRFSADNELIVRHGVTAQEKTISAKMIILHEYNDKVQSSVRSRIQNLFDDFKVENYTVDELPQFQEKLRKDLI